MDVGCLFKYLYFSSRETILYTEKRKFIRQNLNKYYERKIEITYRKKEICRDDYKEV
jgi:hypothetical protein